MWFPGPFQTSGTKSHPGCSRGISRTTERPGWMEESPSPRVSQMKRSRARALPRAHKWLAETPMSGSRPTPHTHRSGSFQNCCPSRWPLGCGALKLNPGPAQGCPWTPPHNPCTEGPSVCIQDCLEGCYSGSLLPLGSPSRAGPGSVPCCALAAVCRCQR